MLPEDFELCLDATALWGAEAHVWDAVRKRRVLTLSGLGEEPETATFAAKLVELVRQRNRNPYVTAISSRLPEAELGLRYPGLCELASAQGIRPIAIVCKGRIVGLRVEREPNQTFLDSKVGGA